MALGEQPPSRPPVAAAARDLSPAEFDALGALLAGIPEPLEPLALDGADGFAAAIAVQPAAIEPERWLKWVFDARGLRWGEARPSPERVRAEALLVRREAAIRRALAETGGFDPWLAEPEAGTDPVIGTVAPWIAGFFSALDVFALDAAESDPGPAMALARLDRYLQPSVEDPPASVDAAIGDMVGCVWRLYEVAERSRYRVDPARRSTPKVGRNDPCPCGSGRKFKQCHGAAR